MKSKLVIFGVGEFANIAFQYFNFDSNYEVVGFVVDSEFKESDLHNGLPVISTENFLSEFSPKSIELFIAISASKMNCHREEKYHFFKEKGYSFATYISSSAFVWSDVHIGENSFIFEANVIQPNVKIGNNTILWSGNHIGHQSTIGDNVFISSHVVVSGFCNIGRNSYLGVNSTIIDKVVLADFTLVGAAALIRSNTLENTIYVGNPSKVVPGKKSIDVSL